MDNLPSWSNWQELNSQNLKNLPESQGIYRLKLKDKELFVIETINEQPAFRLMRSKRVDIKKILLGMENNPLTRVFFDKNKGKTYTDLAYVGMTNEEKRSIKIRLQEHHNNSNVWINGLLSEKKPKLKLFFSYLKTDKAVKGEIQAYKEFIKDIGGYCPPADGGKVEGSNECGIGEGCHLEIWLKRRGKTYQKVWSDKKE